jgi:hypothetical protein
VDDKTRLTVEQLVKGSHEFFPESSIMGRTYLSALRGVVSSYYDSKRENKELMKKGAVFFLVTCVLDYIVSTL